MRKALAIMTLVGLLFTSLAASAAELRAFVAEVTVSPADSGELRGTLKKLLVSRLAAQGVAAADSAGEADVVITASYTVLGKMFSLDAAARTPAGSSVASAFEQGEASDGPIPAVGKLAEKLAAGIAKEAAANAAKAPRTRVPVPTAAPAVPPAAVPVASPQIEKATAAEVVRRESDSSWTSQRLQGAFKSIAAGGGDLYLAVDGKGLSLYRRSDTLSQLDRALFPVRYQVLAVDSLAGADGKTFAFVSLIDTEYPASRIYAVENGTLKLVAENLPYLFRVLAPFGGEQKLYAQEMGRAGEYYGEVFEAGWDGRKVKAGSQIKLPKGGNVFNFNVFRDRSGAAFFTLLNDSGYLLVFSDKGEELWRSSDKFGGSETNFQVVDLEFERSFGNRFRTKFIDQRITVTPQGELIVPQNSGFLVLGNTRSYSKYSVFAFAWNGSSLEERWRVKESQNYLADYRYLPQSKELVLLEVVQKEGIFDKGASAVKVLKVE